MFRKYKNNIQHIYILSKYKKGEYELDKIYCLYKMTQKYLIDVHELSKRTDSLK